MSGDAFAVERACTCRDRCAECVLRGWHEVDSHDAFEVACADACALARDVGVAYRVVDRMDLVLWVEEGASR